MADRLSILEGQYQRSHAHIKIMHAHEACKELHAYLRKSVNRQQLYITLPQSPARSACLRTVHRTRTVSCINDAFHNATTSSYTAVPTVTDNTTPRLHSPLHKRLSTVRQMTWRLQAMISISTTVRYTSSHHTASVPCHIRSATASSASACAA